MAVDIPPGATTGRHTHLGDEHAVVLQGTLELRAEGRETRRVSAGDAYHNPRGLIHETRNVGLLLIGLYMLIRTLRVAWA